MPQQLAMAEGQVRDRLSKLGQWFHNIHFDGIQTAPDHFLGDFPDVKWRRLRQHIPLDLSGKSVLDIGCNGGFYSLEMKKRGAARVLGIDSDERYLKQAEFAAEMLSLKIEFQKMSVYQVAELKERFDIVLFMGVLYHLRYPLLALDLLREHSVGDLLVVQSLLRGDNSVAPLANDYPFSETQLFKVPGYPVLHFVEHRYASDPTNWWIPNRAAFEAMIRSAGFEIRAQADEDTFLCRCAARSGPPTSLGELPGVVSSL